MSDKSNSLVDVIILNYNGMVNHYLPACLGSLAHQTYSPIQVIVVDNASTDDSVSFIREQYPNIQLKVSGENLGFCRGNNLGFQFAEGEYVLFANNDTVFHEKSIEYLVRASKLNSHIGMVAPKLIRPYLDINSLYTLDSTGLQLKKDITLRDRGFDEVDSGRFDDPCLLFAPCGAAAFFRRDVLNSVCHDDGTLWDEDFFAYYEDGDLAWRIHNKGWVCLYYPLAVVEHHRGGSSPASFFDKPTAFKVHTIKNRYLMMLKNMSLKMFMQHIPHLLVRELLIWGYIIIHPRLGFAVIQALRDTYTSALLKRKSIQPSYCHYNHLFAAISLDSHVLNETAD